MAYTFISKLIPVSSYKLKAPYDMTPQFICIHNTFNDAASTNEIAYMTTNTSSTSFHVAIDDKQVIQAIPFNRNAFHAGDGASGDGNRKSIGIEICYSKSGGQRYLDAEANTVEYVAQLLKQFGWGVDRVRTHKSWTEIGVKKGISSYVKNCPHRILDEGQWQSFLDRIAKRLDELKKPTQIASTPTPQPTQQNKEEKYLNLTSWQKDEMAAIFKLAREKGVFSSAEHEANAKAGKMTYDQAIFLMTSIAGAALNNGVRVK